jgi:hypothetical protein
VTFTEKEIREAAKAATDKQASEAEEAQRLADALEE